MGFDHFERTLQHTQLKSEVHDSAVLAIDKAMYALGIVAVS